MKKIILILILFIPIKVLAYSARNIIAMDMDTNRVLYGENINEKNLIASISKIMSAIIAIENKDLDSEVLVSDIIYSAFGSSIYIEEGETLKLKDLLYGLMLRSGNDASLVIAKFVGGNLDNFVKLMNEKARDLKMTNTKFINPHGLEDNLGKGNISTAYDMAILTSYAMQNDIYKKIVSTKEYNTKSDKKNYYWTNKNKLLNTYPYITGGKTGFTKKAHRTLVSTASKDNKNIVIVTLNDGNDWLDHKNLYEKIFNNYKQELIIDKNKFKIDKENYYKKGLYIKDNVYLLLEYNEKKDISLNINLRKIENYEDNSKVGVIEIKLKEDIVKTVPIYIKKVNEDKEKLNWFQKIIRWFKK